MGRGGQQVNMHDQEISFVSCEHKKGFRKLAIQDAATWLAGPSTMEASDCQCNLTVYRLSQHFITRGISDPEGTFRY